MTARQAGQVFKLWAAGSLLGVTSPIWLVGIFVYPPWRRWRTGVGVRGLPLWAGGSLVGVTSPMWLVGLFLYPSWRRWRTRVGVRQVLSLIRSQKGEIPCGTY